MPREVMNASSTSKIGASMKRKVDDFFHTEKVAMLIRLIRWLLLHAQPIRTGKVMIKLRMEKKLIERRNHGYSRLNPMKSLDSHKNLHKKSSEDYITMDDID